MCFHRVHTSLVCFSRCAFTPCTHTWASVYCVRFICLDIRFKVVERQYRTSLGARASPTPSLPLTGQETQKRRNRLTPHPTCACVTDTLNRACAPARGRARAEHIHIAYTLPCIVWSRSQFPRRVINTRGNVMISVLWKIKINRLCSTDAHPRLFRP